MRPPAGKGRPGEAAMPRNPHAGEVWEHRDGGRVYVLQLNHAQVQVQRRPFGDSQARPWWQKLENFHASVMGRTRPCSEGGLEAERGQRRAVGGKGA